MVSLFIGFLVESKSEIRFRMASFSFSSSLMGKRVVRWPKRLNHKSISQNTNQFPKTQINFPKHKLIFQNTNQFSKTQINFPKHKSVSQNTNQFPKTQINFPKHKSITRNTNQFHESLISFLANRLGTTLI